MAKKTEYGTCLDCEKELTKDNFFHSLHIDCEENHIFCFECDLEITDMEQYTNQWSEPVCVDCYGK